LVLELKNARLTFPTTLATSGLRLVAEENACVEGSSVGQEGAGGEEEESSYEECPLWEEHAARHAEVIGHLDAGVKVLKAVAKDEGGEYLAPLMTRIAKDFRLLRATIYQSQPVGENDGVIITRGEVEAKKNGR
jgi:hypothetical protein